MMKKILLLALAVITALSLSGCFFSLFGNGSKKLDPQPLFEFIGPAAMEFAENFENDFPVSVSVRHDYGTSGTPYVSTDKDVILEVASALYCMEVVSDEGWAHTDDFTYYSFNMADGSGISFQFQEGCFVGNEDRKFGVTGYDRLSAALSPASPGAVAASDVYKPGNDANGGWALQEGKMTYLGTEYGLFHLTANDEFYHYAPYLTGGLNTYFGYMIYAKYFNSFANGTGLYAFELNPASEPYPTEAIYYGATFFPQVKADDGSIYFLGNAVLSRASLEPLIFNPESGPPVFQLEGIGPNSNGWQPIDNAYDDSVPLPPPPPETPQSIALAPSGIYTVTSISGARYSESVYLYHYDGRDAEMVEALNDIACRGMFWYEPAGILFFRYNAELYDSTRAELGDGSSGIYGMYPEGKEIIKIYDEGKSDFNFWYDEKNNIAFLILAGGVNEGSSPGVYSVDLSGELPGEAVCLYDGPAEAPNIAQGYVYFRAPSDREDALYEYYRVPADGSSGAERLDFEERTITAVK